MPVGGGDLPHVNPKAHTADAENTSGNVHFFLTFSCAATSLGHVPPARPSFTLQRVLSGC